MRWGKATVIARQCTQLSSKNQKEKEIRHDKLPPPPHYPVYLL